jgi:hypothetical protein
MNGQVCDVSGRCMPMNRATHTYRAFVHGKALYGSRETLTMLIKSLGVETDIDAVETSAPSSVSSDATIEMIRENEDIDETTQIAPYSSVQSGRNSLASSERKPSQLTADKDEVFRKFQECLRKNRA